MEPTDGTVARACQEALDRPKESLVIGGLGATALLVPQVPYAVAALVWGASPWPWLLVGHLVLGGLVVLFALTDRPDVEEGWYPGGGPPPKGPATLLDRTIDGLLLGLLLLLGGLLPLVAIVAGIAGGLRHAGGRLLLAASSAPAPLRVHLRDGTLVAEGHLPAHVRLAAATGPGVRPALLRRLAARLDGVLHAGPWGAALSVRGRILLTRGRGDGRT
jgi:hypothetical protein